MENIRTRVVKRSLNLRTSNFKFEFVFVFQLFHIRIQASLIRRRRFCLENGALLVQRCTVLRFLCSLLAVNSSNARHVFAYPFPSFPSPPYIPPWHSITLRLALRPWHCCILIQAIKETNLGGPDTEQTSNNGNRARLIALFILFILRCNKHSRQTRENNNIEKQWKKNCFPVCGVCVVTFISPHSADIKRKLLKLLPKYMNKVRI